MRRDGATFQEIGKALGVHTSTAWQLIQPPQQQTRIVEFWRPPAPPKPAPPPPAPSQQPRNDEWRTPEQEWHAIRAGL
jgi:hypothetical protein